MKIDSKKLSELLDVPVVFTVGNKNEGIDKLLTQAIELAESNRQPQRGRKVKYSKDIEDSILELKRFIELKTDKRLPYDVRWTAIKLLEDDRIVKQRLQEAAGLAGVDIIQLAEKLRAHLADRFDDDPQIIMTDERYGFISGIIKEVLTSTTQQRIDISRSIDLVLTNRFIGFPIFIFFIWAMFQLTFTLGDYPTQLIEAGVNLLSEFVKNLMPETFLKDLLVNGVIAGVGSVVVFLPNILILFFCIAIFEDTGYMARAAFLMDKIMHLIGLHGKSFIPMLMGFGCNVPAIMAARTLESEKDRILTILITPFMSCSAKLPVYIILAGAFFGTRAGTVISSIYLVGIMLSILTGRLFRATLLKGADAPFVMELPPYRAPTIKSLLIHMWDRSRVFLRKMGGIILIGSIVVWVLSSFPRNIQYSIDYKKEINKIKSSYSKLKSKADPSAIRLLESMEADELSKLRMAQRAERAEKSYMGHLGRAIAPVFSPLGIDWRGGVALLTGFVAKEIVVSTIGILHAVKGEAEPEALKNALSAAGMTSLSALAMMIFVLLYLPCLATTTAIRRETGSYKWMFLSIGYSTGIAWLAAFMVYQGGKLLGFT